MKFGDRQVSLTRWAGIALFLGLWLLCLWVLIERMISGRDVLTFKVALLVLALVLMGRQIYREILEALSYVEEEPPSADAHRDMASAREAVAQSKERWVCMSCGESTPADYGACIYCGRPSGSMR